MNDAELEKLEEKIINKDIIEYLAEMCKKEQLTETDIVFIDCFISILESKKKDNEPKLDEDQVKKIYEMYEKRTRKNGYYIASCYSSNVEAY